MKKNSNDIRDYNHVDLLYPSRYLKSGDLRGRDVTLTIKSIEPRHELKRTDGGSEAKPVVHFEGTEKMWVMNKTNAKTIAELYGSEVMTWLGKRIVLYPTTVQAFGKPAEAIRVRSTIPPPKRNGNGQAQPPPPQAPEVPPEDDAPPFDQDTGEVLP